MPFALERLSRLMAREVYDMSRNSRLLFRGSGLSAELVVCGLGRRKETWADFESGLSSIICSGSEGSVLSALAFAAASNVGIMHLSPMPRRLSSSSNVVAVVLSSSSVAVIAVCAVSDVGAVASVPPDTPRRLSSSMQSLLSSSLLTVCVCVRAVGVPSQTRCF